MSGSSLRSRAAFTLSVLAVPAALVIVVPTPSHLFWILRLLALESGFAPALVALLALALALRGEPRTSLDWTTAVLAVPTLVVTLLPALAILLAYRGTGQRFSPIEFVRGLATPPIEVLRDLVLDPERPALTSDVYRALGPGPHPFVVVVHGGSWQGGDKGQVPHLSDALAAAGFTVVDVRYRLAPASLFPAAVADVKCQLGRVRERARELDVDPARAALLGRSAGGQVALVAAYSAGEPRLPPSCAVADEPVRAVVSLYAPTDMAWGHANPIRPDIVEGPKALETYLGGTPEQAPEAYRLASPITWADRPPPPTLLIHGRGDRFVFVEHALRLARGLRERGAMVELLVVPFADHAFDARAGGVGEQLARGTILRFLAGVSTEVNAPPPFPSKGVGG